ncbi:hypothetical protein ACIRU3_43665 [Streptomyces sp. NPDC101151]|uniref:hypothetical protein n=1 Tax=Streptomyces sp. NPDC101151 TaxID=3366115 RepID=UPI00381CC273
MACSRRAAKFGLALRPVAYGCRPPGFLVGALAEDQRLFHAGVLEKSRSGRICRINDVAVPTWS